MLFLGPQIGSPIFHSTGTLETWQARIAARCVGNSRLIFSLGAAFAGPLLGICHEENGGFHLRGASSTGKTTSLYVAASLFGGKDYIQRWRATANGLEATAKMYNDLLLPLDEMGEINPKDAGEVAYMLGNGTGKARARADKSGGARDKAKFRCLFLSTGEISLACGDDQDLEEKKILSKIQLFFEMHGDSRFTSWHKDFDTKTYNRAGFKKTEDDRSEYYVLEEVFKNEICQGSDWKKAAKLLIKKGYLKSSTDGKSTRTESLPGIGPVRCYRFQKIPSGKEE